jgi:hypothetical protein
LRKSLVLKGTSINAGFLGDLQLCRRYCFSDSAHIGLKSFTQSIAV